MLSIHPYEPFVPRGATRLIVGTMPPYRFCIEPKQLNITDVDFYYGSKDNEFWHLVEQVSGETFDYELTEKAIAQRKAFLEKRKIGITDIVKSCTHINGKSDDASLKSIEPKPLQLLLEANKTIDTLIYTGRNNQQNSVKWLINHFAADRGYHNKIANGIVDNSVLIGGKTYSVILLCSPSPNALRSIDSKIRLEQYKAVFA